MALVQKDSLLFLKDQTDYKADIIFCDPPYGLGSEVIIRPDGKPDYQKASDFMSKWDMPTGAYWEDWFKEAYRTLKHGGYCVMYGMDRQLLLFKYYASLAGFAERQSLYWFFISNFPKASDLSKNLDKHLGQFVPGETSPNSRDSGKSPSDAYGQGVQKKTLPNPQSDLAQKYDGYKYSVSPLKQTNETIMVFAKPYKTGSCLHDTLAYENGDKTCCCGALDIDGNRCGIEKVAGGGGELAKNGIYEGGTIERKKDTITENIGRYPAQTFVSPEAAEVLDRQSGEVARGGFPKLTKDFTGKSNITFRGGEIREKRKDFNDSGGCSKILHKCPYEEGEMDLQQYQEYGELNVCQNAKDAEMIMSQKDGRPVFAQENVSENTSLQEGDSLAKYLSDAELAEWNGWIMQQTSLEKISIALQDALAKLGQKADDHALSVESLVRKPQGYSVHILALTLLYGLKESLETGLVCLKKIERKYTASSIIEAEVFAEGMLNAFSVTSQPLKPISLNERILKLFKTPNPQKILYPFAGSGSEVIGGIRAGFTDWEGCELNPEYIEIAEARIKHWSQKPTVRQEVLF